MAPMEIRISRFKLTFIYIASEASSVARVDLKIRFGSEKLRADYEELVASHKELGVAVSGILAGYY